MAINGECFGVLMLHTFKYLFFELKKKGCRIIPLFAAESSSKTTFPCIYLVCTKIGEKNYTFKKKKKKEIEWNKTKSAFQKSFSFICANLILISSSGRLKGNVPPHLTFKLGIFALVAYKDADEELERRKKKFLSAVSSPLSPLHSWRQAWRSETRHSACL